MNELLDLVKEAAFSTIPHALHAVMLCLIAVA